MSQGQTAYLILGILSIEPQKSGYDIRKAVESSVSYFWRESYGQIYPTLKRLAAEGLIVPCRAKGKGRAERQAYSLSPAGRQRLQAWLALPYREDPPRNEFLLKLFFSKAVPAGTALKHVEDFREKNEQLLGALLAIEKTAKANGSPSSHLPYWMLTLSYGIAQVRASVEWSNGALATLASLDAAAAKGAKKEQGLRKRKGLEIC